MYLID